MLQTNALYGIPVVDESSAKKSFLSTLSLHTPQVEYLSFSAVCKDRSNLSDAMCTHCEFGETQLSLGSNKQCRGGEWGGAAARGVSRTGPGGGGGIPTQLCS